MNEKKDFKDILSALIEDENSVQLTAEEQGLLDEVMELLKGFDKNLQSLHEAEEEGLERDEWLTQKLTDSIKRIAKTEEEQERLLNAINESALRALGDAAGEQKEEPARNDEQTQLTKKDNVRKEESEQ